MCFLKCLKQKVKTNYVQQKTKENQVPFSTQDASFLYRSTGREEEP